MSRESNSEIWTDSHLVTGVDMVVTGCACRAGLVPQKHIVLFGTACRRLLSDGVGRGCGVFHIFCCCFITR